MSKILILVAAGVLPVGFILGLAWLIAGRYKKKLFAAPAQLGHQMGLDKVASRQGSKRNDWFGGQFQGHPFALTYVTQKGKTNNIDGRTISKALPHLRLVMGIHPQKGFEVDLHRHPLTTWEITDFESVFRNKKKGIEHFGPSQQKALLNFAQEFGNLRLKNRSGFKDQFLPHALFQEDAWVLMSDIGGLDHSSTDVEHRLTGMLQLADILKANP